MINSEEAGAKHPENAKSLFQMQVENHSMQAKDKVCEARKCNLCSDGQPMNVSSGPDWARCDGCGLQAHLRCLSAGQLDAPY